MSETTANNKNLEIDTIEHSSIDIKEVLKHLPPHLVEHIGDLALQLTHIEMHPIKHVEYEGRTYKQVDYTRRILEPNSDELGFEQSAIEAAQAGKEKLSQILHMSSATLALAHAALVAKGYSFEGPENESEEDKNNRHIKEKKDLAEVAYKLATDRAIELKRSGNKAALIEQLEVFNSLTFFIGEKYNDKTSEKNLRNLVHEGLAEDMVLALQESHKIGIGDYEKLTNSLSMQKNLLSMATKKRLNYDFAVEGDLNLESIERLVGVSDLVNVIAVVTSSRIKITQSDREKLLEKAKGFTAYEAIKKKLDTLPSYADGSEYYHLAERCYSEATTPYAFALADVIALDDPLTFGEYSKKLGLSIQDSIQLIAPVSKEDFKRYFDRQSAESLLELSAGYPLLFQSIIEHSKKMQSTANLSEVLRMSDKLKSSGVSTQAAYNALLTDRTEGIDELADSIIYLFEYAKKKGLSESEIVEKLSHTKAGENFYWALKEPVSFSGKNKEELSQEQKSERLQSRIDNLMIESSVFKAYKNQYENLSYPASPDTVKMLSLGLDNFPEIEGQMLDLGLDKETAKSIFSAWATYNALLVHSYSNENGFSSINTVPKDNEMNDILEKQHSALKGQLKALKDYHNQYGETELKEIISIFGIYNFNRHKSSALHEQLERWKNGQKVETIVAESRADWNSYTGKQVKFEDESENPSAFYFEVNSPLELSRLAVMVGQRERSFGREPDINRFIIHAHGNPTGLLLGVNREMLNVDSYKKAAKNRTKIKGAESNDYKRHLGPNYSVILQSCSTAGQAFEGNIASTMASAIEAPVTGAVNTISSLTIKSDGTVEFDAGHKETVESITY